MGVTIGRLISQGNSFQIFTFVAGIGVILATSINVSFGLGILIFSMLLSPELKIAEVPARAVVLRIDDILLFIIFFTWLAKMAVNKELGLLKFTPLNRPILVYILVCIISTAKGVVQDTTNLNHSFFYILKYIEYFIVFFMVSNNLRDKKQIKIFVFLILLTCFIVSAYALNIVFVSGMRASAPFEGKSGEPNTLAGYLLIIIGIVMGLFFYVRSLSLRFCMGIFFAFIILPFLYTLSRAGWLGFSLMYISFLFFSKRGKGILLLSLICIIAISPLIFPKRISNRFQSTFIGTETYTVFGKETTLDESASLRIKSAKDSLKAWSEYPVLGRGVPGGGTVSDVQWTRILREVGIVGFAAFAWIIVVLFKAGWRSFSSPEIDDFGRGLSVGFICALVGLLAMGVGAEVFIIIRIMEPFWFLAAIVVKLPEISTPVPQIAGIKKS